MKNIKLLLSFSFLVLHFSFSHGQSWLWTANAFTKTPADPQCPVATDRSGNAYVTGTTQTDTLYIGNTKLMGKYSVTYLAKYNPAGAVVWVRQISGSNTSDCITTDKSGNVYIAGSFGDTIKIGASTLISPLGNDVFLAKFDSNGNPLWAKQSQAPTKTSLAGTGFIATDMFNNVFATGDFEDTVSFGSYTLNMFNTSQGNDRAVFIVKYDSNGNALWAEQSKTSSAADYGGSSYSVATDKLGNSFITGYFSDTLSFGSYSLVGGGAFLVKYSAAGSVLWAEQNAGGLCMGSSVITDGINPYITGSFENNVQFGSHTLSSPGQYSIFLTKYDVNGNAIWAEKSSEEWIGDGLAADAYNHIYLTGTSYEAKYIKQVSFGSYTLANPLIETSSFIMEFDTAGSPLCGSLLDNRSSEATNGVASDPLGKYIYLSSIFGDTLFYSGDTVLGTGAGYSTFVVRWRSCTLTNGVASISSQNASVLVYPNPSNGEFTMVESGKLKMENEKSNIEVYNMLGEKVYSQFSTLHSPFSINLSGEPNGIYLYHVIDETGNLIGDGKLVIQK